MKEEADGRGIDPWLISPKPHDNAIETVLLGVQNGSRRSFTVSLLMLNLPYFAEILCVPILFPLSSLTASDRRLKSPQPLDEAIETS